MSSQTGTPLPLIVGFGGYNAAGRSSFHHAYRRMILESLSSIEYDTEIANLAVMMSLASVQDDGNYLCANGGSVSRSELSKLFGARVQQGTLVRRIGERDFFDPARVLSAHHARLSGSAGESLSFTLRKRQLPNPVPEDWHLSSVDGDDKKVLVSTQSLDRVLLETHRDLPVKAAGQLPEGFDPSAHYPSRFHPRGLQLAVLGASDAIRSMGISWEKVLSSVSPDSIAMYASSVMSQLDDLGLGGMLKSRLQGGRVSTKQLALGLNTMPADFVNAYVLGNVGMTSSVAGACASFLYNLRVGIDDIRSGRRRVVVVGNSEAPITSEIIDGYSTMGALGTDEALCKLDGVSEPDYRRASRPFSGNCGFTIAESSQYIVLMDDALAMELGAQIYGAATDVFVNADGFKKSISAPGAGNFLTFAKAVASARNILGEDIVRHRSFVQAHGSSTPLNRVSESEIFDRVAGAFGIENWPVAAVKSYLGHSLGPASGDQLSTSLGVFEHGIVPGIKTIDHIAEDVHQQHLHFPLQDLDCREQGLDVAFLNSKGFGGNNATGVVLSPRITESMLEQRYGKAQFMSYQSRREQYQLQAQDYDVKASRGDLNVIYRFGENMVDESQIEISPEKIKVPGFEHAIDLEVDNPYSDMR
ncbi:beta-ketoacyl synthase [Marinibactrum halimedae]|uniref:Beta-ketoacyl-[acyl-carrier-protein] synthase FabY n=1 Tax=Marinibactrum halimedae TaxID=1444977 RepID=A0AA37TCY5_9GAMM|nr:beta-ketoacyl synthase [Marinibactrum halimedae]MCD9459853.1 beta-ketoacyl synthase [Marinibactrum halimedae]GLS26952.1 beta-ketoacyl-[acyl-carrier-protein] synthase FabY [Marinibactrum halimedae]